MLRKNWCYVCVGFYFLKNTRICVHIVQRTTYQSFGKDQCTYLYLYYITWIDITQDSCFDAYFTHIVHKHIYLCIRLSVCVYMCEYVCICANCTDISSITTCDYNGNKVSSTICRCWSLLEKCVKQFCQLWYHMCREITVHIVSIFSSEHHDWWQPNLYLAHDSTNISQLSSGNSRWS